MKQHIIYIPGLGDGYDGIRKFGLRLWRRRNQTVTHIPMRWLDKNETLEDKLDRIKKAIDTHPDMDVVLVGESAGGAVALVALHRYQSHLKRAVTVCGMNKGADDVNRTLYEKNPAFEQAMQEADKIHRFSNDKYKGMLSTIYSSYDFTVRPKNTLIEGVRSYDLKVPGHLLAIASVVLFRYSLVTKKE